ncbi:hypothetical protein PFISCL1PPCAC_27295 [Pristionchus fissidentatus]|uniref:G protein-coupled receptor n=1 Tax=Pristionchus fissidentatus TaxID=1538716 RepID=A0AAV5X0I5_9BILA|nr:hypothetical protein PFISCL1PPCAC_27295 [Pristionchus fissidentatus]
MMRDVSSESPVSLVMMIMVISMAMLHWSRMMNNDVLNDGLLEASTGLLVMNVVSDDMVNMGTTGERNNATHMMMVEVVSNVVMVVVESNRFVEVVESRLGFGTSVHLQDPLDLASTVTFNIVTSGIERVSLPLRFHWFTILFRMSDFPCTFLNLDILSLVLIDFNFFSFLVVAKEFFLINSISIRFLNMCLIIIIRKFRFNLSLFVFFIGSDVIFRKILRCSDGVSFLFTSIYFLSSGDGILRFLISIKVLSERSCRERNEG